MPNSKILNTTDAAEPRKRAKSARFLAANRANAQKSIGPRSPEGKSRSRFNSLAHGLTAKEVCLPGESREEYDQRRLEYFEDHRPASLLEADILDDYFAARWRKDRATRFEKCLVYERFMQRRVNISEQYESITLDVESALAFRELGDESAVLKNLDRYETRILRNLQLGYTQLMELRANRPPVPDGLTPVGREPLPDTPTEPALSGDNSHPRDSVDPAPITDSIHTTVIPKKQSQPASKTMFAGATVQNEPVSINGHSQLSAHNSSLIATESQLVTHI